MTTFITRHKKNIYFALAAVFWVLIWHAASVIVGHSMLLSSPWEVLKALFRLSGERAFWLSAFGSIMRISLGFFSAFTAGILLACASARFSFIKILLSPFMATIKSMPVASLTILLILWLPSSQSLASAVSFIMVLPLIYTTTLHGILSRDEKLREMAVVFEITRLRRLVYIDFPQLAPRLLSVCSVALGLAWKSGVAAEVIGIIKNSLGGELYNNKLLFATENVLAITITVILLSFLFEKLVSLIFAALTKAVLQGGKL